MEQAERSGEVDPDFRVLPSSELGGYGQYYAGSIYALGLSRTDEQRIHLVTERGEDIAKAYHQAVVYSSYIAQELYNKPGFDFLQPKDSASTLSLDTIRDADAAKERELLTDLLFGFSDGGSAPSPP